MVPGPHWHYPVMWGYLLRGFFSIPGERLDRADGGEDGEKGVDLRAVLGVKWIRLSDGPSPVRLSG